MFLGFEWTDWMNNDHPENGLSTGDWETINSFGERSVCGNPTGVQAYPIDRNAGSTAVTHIGRFKTIFEYSCRSTRPPKIHSAYAKFNKSKKIKPIKMRALVSGVSMMNNPMASVLISLFDSAVPRNGGH